MCLKMEKKKNEDFFLLIKSIMTKYYIQGINISETKNVFIKSVSINLIFYNKNTKKNTFIYSLFSKLDLS